MIPIPRIALVGRPNVGKSTLFNRIAGRRQAITDARPGSTRDRNYAQASWQGAAFELVDTGGLLLGTDDPLLGPAAEQAERAIEESDLVILLVDARAGLLPDDAAIAARLRKTGKRMILAANKAENGHGAVLEFARLGFHETVVISAEHGQGVGELLDAALVGLPRIPAPEEESLPRIALVGRPNVGKSSLLNRLAGAERAVVSELPGTTRDAIDSVVTWRESRYLMVDTAGIRRVRALKERVDHVSVVQARGAIERCDVAVVVVDAEAGPRELDATIAGHAHEAGRGVVVAVNKWDQAKSLGLSQRGFEEELRRHLKFLAYAPVVPVSARTGLGLSRLLKNVDRVCASRQTRVSTGVLNRVVGKAVVAHAPRAARGGSTISILYAAQIGTSPPTFSLSLNRAGDLHFSYRRYLENRLRDAFGFEGTPIVLKTRARQH